ncbi:MAG: hypothetical protein PHN88_02705 [Ignavibacteria bacterium]|nr:hypothetical protein [Ignavibacteria bacterium]
MKTIITTLLLIVLLSVMIYGCNSNPVNPIIPDPILPKDDSTIFYEKDTITFRNVNSIKHLGWGMDTAKIVNMKISFNFLATGAFNYKIIYQKVDKQDSIINYEVLNYMNICNSGSDSVYCSINTDNQKLPQQEYLHSIEYMYQNQYFKVFNIKIVKQK